ncbi:DUF551 domain-containing protein [Citrobacter portucalensis]|uniref:DUF551 domain-containing protein n=1 Tax=Citrobacter portucalensis TaxID=1639133 RepID=UPI00351DA78F
MTTNNHPAHGPVSLDRLHQISEILSKAAAQSDGGNLGYAMADAVKVIDGAIAAFGAEPVAWRYRYVHTPKTEEHGSPFTTEWKLCDSEDECNPSDCFERQPLYTAPPAPVSVPDAISTRQAIAKMESHEPCDSINVAYKFGWNACRSAMLQTGNSPVTPDGWINCRERMPEEGQEIIVMDVTRGEVQSGMIYQNGRFVDFNEESYEVKGPSHWMPLPSAPQQEVE